MSTKIKNKEARLGYRTWIEIDKEAIAHNYRFFRSRIKPETKLMSVVKSNAYGHGLVDFSKEVTELGVDWLAVDSVVEALRLRKEGIQKPMLVLGYTLPEKMQEAIDNKISLTVSNFFELDGLKDLHLKGKLDVHVKIDSGMHRQGFMENEIKKVVEFLKSQDMISVEGLYTHFASAKDPAYEKETKAQIEIFTKWIEAFKKVGFKPIVHAAATGATLIFPYAQFDMVRIGIGFHGLWPSVEIREVLDNKDSLHPTMSWKTIISEMKNLPKGDSVGYDFTETLKRDTRLAVCPIGYWHGYFRSLSSEGIVLVNGVRVKVIGRVSMDMITIDVTDVLDLSVGDEVVLIGSSGDEHIGAHEVSSIADVSVYEFVTRINPLIKKIYQ